MTRQGARDVNIDIARGLGMLLVLVGHALEMYFNESVNGVGSLSESPYSFEIWRVIYSFHMPLFFFLSGLALAGHERSDLQKTLKSALSLYILAILLHLIALPLRIIFPMPGDLVEPGTITIIKMAISTIMTLEPHALVTPWFLMSLAVARIIYYCWESVGRRGALLLVVVLSATLVASSYFDVHRFQVRSAIVGFSFMIAAKHLETSSAMGIVRRGAIPCALVAAFILATTLDLNHGCFFNPLKSCGYKQYDLAAVVMVKGDYGFLPFFYVTALAGIICVYALAHIIATSPIGEKLEWIGRNSLSLLILNGAVVVFVEPHISRLATVVSFPILVAVIVVIQVAALPLATGALHKLNALASAAATLIVDRAARFR